MTKKVLVIIISFLCFAVLAARIMFCGTGVWIGNFKYRFDLSEKKAYFINYRGDGNDILPTNVYGFKVEKTYFTCWVGDYECWFSSREEGKICIQQYHGSGNFVVPNEILGVEVVGLGSMEQNDEITSVYIENNPNEEYWGVDIRNCKNVESVTFEEGTKVIYTDICDSPKLKNLKFPEGVEEIHGSYASSGLEEVYFPKSVVYVSGSRFNGTNFKKNHEDDKYYVVGDNVLLFYNGPKDEIIIPEGIKYLYNYYLLAGDDGGEVEKIYFGESICGLNIELPDTCEAFFGSNEIEGLDSCSNLNGTLV